MAVVKIPIDKIKAIYQTKYSGDAWADFFSNRRMSCHGTNVIIDTDKIAPADNLWLFQKGILLPPTSNIEIMSRLVKCKYSKLPKPLMIRIIKQFTIKVEKNANDLPIDPTDFENAVPSLWETADKKKLSELYQKLCFDHCNENLLRHVDCLPITEYEKALMKYYWFYPLEEQECI